MSKFLCINFNRYETKLTTQSFIEGESGKDVCVKFYEEDGLDEDELEEVLEQIDDTYVQVNDTFGCIEGEENDILIYKID